MSMKFELRFAKNGWILEYFDPEMPQEIVGVESDDEHEGFREFLWAILENFGPSDSKYSKKRIHINILPGRDYEGPLDEKYMEYLRDLREDIDWQLTREQNPNW
jgi:hypothetical protein